MDVFEIPFSRELGLQPGETSAEVVLVPDGRHLNHVGTIHAGVIYSVGETAAGQTLIEHFPELVGKAAPLLRTAQTRYRSPAIPGERLRASGDVEDAAAEEFRTELSSNGRALIEVRTAIHQGERKIFGGTYSFFVSMVGG